MYSGIKVNYKIFTFYFLLQNTEYMIKFKTELV